MDIEPVLRQLLHDLAHISPATRDEIRGNSDTLHSAPSYQEFEQYVWDCIQDSEMAGGVCLAIQAGYQLGLRAARKRIQ